MTILAKNGDGEINKLREFLRKTKDPNERDRARAIVKLIEGRKRRDVANIFEVNIATVDVWQRQFKRYGIKGNQTKDQMGNNHILTHKQKNEIKKTISAKTPKEVGLAGMFWNVPTLKAYVKQKYNLDYHSPVSYTRLFGYCGFTYHKPNKVNKKQSPHMRKRFEEALKKNSNGTVEKIAWYW